MAATKDNEPLVRIAKRKPSEVCAKLDLDEKTRELLQAEPAPSPFLTALIQQELFTDAIAYLAHALPKSDAVYWACTCVRSAVGDKPEAQAALAAGENWARKPGEDLCRAAEAASQDCKVPAAQFVALAAYWSGASLAPPDCPVVPPPPELTGTAVASAIVMAATAGDPAAIPDRFRAYLSKGILIARAPQ